MNPLRPLYHFLEDGSRLTGARLARRTERRRKFEKVAQYLRRKSSTSIWKKIPTSIAFTVGALGFVYAMDADFREAKARADAQQLAAQVVRLQDQLDAREPHVVVNLSGPQSKVREQLAATSKALGKERL